jgi:hypothetical protein
VTAADIDALLASDLSDATNRLVLSDALEDAGRDAEARLCRTGPVAVLRENVVRLHTFRHADDPAAAGWGLWHYVYLHGEAEDRARKEAAENWWGGRSASAPDYVVCNDPPPAEEGDYAATLYGARVVVFVRKPKGRNYLCGRAACPDDAVGFAHASNPDEWR